MTREEKNQFIDVLDKMLRDNNNFCLADISDLSASESNDLRRLCFKKDVSLKVVKNNLLRKALEKNDADFEQLYNVLKGNTSIMFSKSNNGAAKVIKEFRKKHDKPLLKAAHIESEFYIGDEHLSVLTQLKSKEELISEIILLLQSPPKNIISALQSGKNKISGIITTLKEGNRDVEQKVIDTKSEEIVEEKKSEEIVKKEKDDAKEREGDSK